MKKEERYMKFREDMKNAGFNVREYQGRYSYDGPAVTVDRDQYDDVVRATALKLQSDSMGKGIVVYPC